MNYIGIIGAMEEEIEVLKEKMEIKEILNKASMKFYQGILEGREVVIVRSGIGKVNAAICTQILVDYFNIDAVLNTGIAGSLCNDINIGDIVLSYDVLHHDMDAVEFGYEKGVIPRMEKSIFEGDTALIQMAKNICEEVNPEISVFVGRVVSGDQFISSQDKKDEIIRNFQGFCTEMEGAAIAQTASLNNIPFLIIRAISDKADNSAKMDYKEFEEKAIAHTVKLVTALINQL